MTERALKGHSNSGADSSGSEFELLRLMRSRDERGMRLFYERYSAYLTALCGRYVPDRDEAKDILQESFIKAFDNIRRFEYRGEGSLKAWIGKIVVNNALKFLRKERRLGLGQKVELTERFADVPEENDEGMPSIPASELQRMITELPDGYRTVFNLYVFEKHSHREIATMLGIKEDSSASQLFRAKAMLARRIKDYWRAQDR